MGVKKFVQVLLVTVVPLAFTALSSSANADCPTWSTTCTVDPVYIYGTNPPLIRMIHMLVYSRAVEEVVVVVVRQIFRQQRKLSKRQKRRLASVRSLARLVRIGGHV